MMNTNNAPINPIKSTGNHSGDCQKQATVSINNTEKNTSLNKPKKRRDSKNPDYLSKREEEQRIKLISAVEKLPINIGAVPAFTLKPFLCILLPILSACLPEAVYRFVLGMVSLYTSLTNKEVAEIAHSSARRVSKGRSEVAQRRAPLFHKQRRKGGGRKTKITPNIESEIKRYVSLRSYGPCTQGLQEYTAATVRGCQKMLERKLGMHISVGLIYKYLEDNNIRFRKNKKLLYGNQKTETKEQKIMRHLQFDLINEYMEKLNSPEWLVLSVDGKKKENLGAFSSSCGGYDLPDDPVIVNDHDFFVPLNVKTLQNEEDLLSRQEGKAVPYGIYDIALNKGYMNIGISSDTAESVQKLIFLFLPEIRKDHPEASNLLLFCDGGGSNAARCKDFKYQMAVLSKKTGLKITVIHYPPYCSKFNKIERRLFAYVSRKFERCPLYNLQCVLDLARSTTTETGLVVKAELDTCIYKTGQKPTDEQMNSFSCKYFGPTKQAKIKLSYTIDGSKMKDSDLPSQKSITVFDIKENIDLSKEEKQKIKKEKENRKKEREAKAVSETKESRRKNRRTNALNPHLKIDERAIA